MGKIWINRGKRREHTRQEEDMDKDRSPQAASVLPRDVLESLLPLKESQC